MASHSRRTKNILYVDDWDAHHKVVLRFPVNRDGTVGKSEVFADMTQELPGEEALDGMKVDRERQSLCDGAGRRANLFARGAAARHHRCTPPVHNLAWGGEDGRTLYLCATDRLYRISLLQRRNPAMNAPDSRPRCAARNCRHRARVAGDQRHRRLCVELGELDEYPPLSRPVVRLAAPARGARGHGVEARCHGALRRRARSRSLPMNSPTAPSRREALPSRVLPARGSHSGLDAGSSATPAWNSASGCGTAKTPPMCNSRASAAARSCG